MKNDSLFVFDKKVLFNELKPYITDVNQQCALLRAHAVSVDSEGAMINEELFHSFNVSLQSSLDQIIGTIEGYDNLFQLN